MIENKIAEIFEQWISGAGSNCFTNCTTTTAGKNDFCCNISTKIAGGHLYKILMKNSDQKCLAQSDPRLFFFKNYRETDFQKNTKLVMRDA